MVARLAFMSIGVLDIMLIGRYGVDVVEVYAPSSVFSVTSAAIVARTITLPGTPFFDVIS